jgi:hypothetical protein
LKFHKKESAGWYSVDMSVLQCTLRKNRIRKKPGKFEKTHGNGKNWFLPEKMGKTGKTV